MSKVILILVSFLFCASGASQTKNVAKTAMSGWFANNIAGNPSLHPVLCTIGNHVFYA